MRKDAEQAKRDPDKIEIVLGAQLGRINESTIQQARAVASTRILLSASPEARELDDVLEEMSTCARRLGLSTCG